MKNIAVVNLQKDNNKRTKREIEKFVASINNTQYNMSIEYYTGTTTVKEFSIGFTLKELHINDDRKNQLKTTNDKNMAAFSVFYNFINYSKYDLMSLEESPKSQKVTMYKNHKINYYGISGTNTTKVNLKLAKVSTIFMLILNIYEQIKDNEDMLETLKNNKKQFPHDQALKDALAAQIDQRKQLKLQFMDIIKNTIKRFF